jgi:hypothetical protein
MQPRPCREAPLPHFSDGEHSDSQNRDEQPAVLPVVLSGFLPIETLAYLQIYTHQINPPSVLGTQKVSSTPSAATTVVLKKKKKNESESGT